VKVGCQIFIHTSLHRDLQKSFGLLAECVWWLVVLIVALIRK